MRAQHPRLPVSDFYLTGYSLGALDAAFVAELGLPSIVLMETASRALARAVRAALPRPEASVVVVCGPGNNGGDGYGCARWLHAWGVRVATWSLAAESRGDAAVMRQACARLGVPQAQGVAGAELIVDAVLGTGLDRPVRGAAADAIRDQFTAMGITIEDTPDGPRWSLGEATKSDDGR